jgi:hypothetical protein
VFLEVFNSHILTQKLKKRLIHQMVEVGGSKKKKKKKRKKDV